MGKFYNQWHVTDSELTDVIHWRHITMKHDPSDVIANGVSISKSLCSSYYQIIHG
jgi:hypothetical protein